MWQTNQKPYHFSESEKEIIASPFASYWLKTQVAVSHQRDVLDALKDAEALVQILSQRWAQTLKEDLEGLIQ